MENKCMPDIVGQIISTSKSSQDTGAEFKEFRDISGMIKGTFPFYPEKVVGNSVEDIFSLTDQDVLNTLMKDMPKPIQVSLRPKKDGNNLAVSFDITIQEISDLYNPQCRSIRKNENIEHWVHNNLGVLQGVSKAVESYVAQALEILIPILDRKATVFYEKSLPLAAYHRIVNYLNKDIHRDSDYQIKTIKGRIYLCIKGKKAFRGLLSKLDLEYEDLELLKIFKYLGLLLTNAGREYTFYIKSESWWYCIRYDELLIQKAEEVIQKFEEGAYE